uniref:Uncharacterized protein n=1 Tax=Anguilla anguilla TaxID=7936 RepID=A0A0E9XZ28_ANGAN
MYKANKVNKKRKGSG